MAQKAVIELDDRGCTATPWPWEAVVRRPPKDGRPKLTTDRAAFEDKPEAGTAPAGADEMNDEVHRLGEETVRWPPTDGQPSTEIG